MKKIFLAIVMIATNSAWACDACGCSGMTVGFGDLSFYNQNSIGIGYSLRQFNTGNGISDYYHQMDFNASYTLNSRWSLFLSVPYIMAYRNQPETEMSLKGISDISLKANYFLLRLGTEDKNHRIKLGASLNLPTGKFELREASLIPDNFQIGTGALDFQVEIEYQFGYKNWVYMGQARYLFNQKNSSDYKFGNQGSLQALAAYKVPMAKMALVPILSVSYEHFARDINPRGFYQYGTGGQGLNVQLACQVKLKNILFSLRAGGNIRNHSNGDYKPGLQAYFSTNYLF